MTLTKEMQAYLIVLLLPISILLFLLIANEKSILISPMLISILNFALIIYALMSRYFQHLVFKIYFAYHILTMILPIFMLVLPYPEHDALMFLAKYMITGDDLLKSNIINLAYDLILVGSVIFFNKFNFIKSQERKFLNYYILNDKKYLLIILIALFAYSMKIYLISIDAWYVFGRGDLTLHAFANTADLLQKLDVLVLLFIAYNYKYDKSKTMLFLMFSIILISLFFAVISTSKAKLFMVLIPILMLAMQTKYKNYYITLALVFFMSSGLLFKYMMYLRIHNTTSIVENTQKFFSYQQNTSSKKDIFKDDLLIRLGYQIVFSRAIKVYDNEYHEYKFDYANNIIGLIPRFIWPDKPIIGIDGNQVGHDLGLIAKNDYGTSVGILPIGEAFYELGYLGIVIIPIFTAFLLFYFSKILLQEIWIGYLLSVMIGITIGTTDWYNPLIPTLLKMFIIFYIFGLLLNRKFSNEVKLHLKWR